MKERGEEIERDPTAETRPRIPLMLESVEPEDDDEPAAVDDGPPPPLLLIVTRAVNAGKMCHRASVTEADEKAVATGTIFAQAILLIIHRASPSVTATICNSMKTNADSIVAADVKVPLESVHEDIIITCEHVGGLLTDTRDYDEGIIWPKSKCMSKS